MKMIEAAFFDLYGTLIRIHTDEENLGRVWKPLSYLYGYYGASYTPEALREAYRGQIEKQEAIVPGPTMRRSCGNFCCEVSRGKSDGSSSRRRNSHA